GLWQIQPANFREAIERNCRVNFISPVANWIDWRWLAIEFILNWAHKLFKHILERDHARHAAIFVDKHSQMHAITLKLNQQVIEANCFRQERHSSCKLAQVGSIAIRAVAEQVLHVDHAKDCCKVITT